MPKSNEDSRSKIKKSEDPKMSNKEKPCLILCGQNQLVRLDQAQPDSLVIASLYFSTCVALEIRKGQSVTFAHIDSSTDLNFILEEIKYLEFKGNADQPITIDVRCIEGLGDENLSKINQFLKENTVTKELLNRDNDAKCWSLTGAFHKTSESISDAIFVSKIEDTKHGPSWQVEELIKNKKFDFLHSEEYGDKVYEGDLKIGDIAAKGLLYSQILIKYWAAITNLEEILLLKGKTCGTRPIVPIFDEGKYLPEFTNPKLCKKAVDAMKDLFTVEISNDNPNIFFDNPRNRVTFLVEVVSRNKYINSKLLKLMIGDMVWVNVFNPSLQKPESPKPSPEAVLSRSNTSDKSVAGDLQIITKSFQAWQLMTRKDMAKGS